LLTCDPSYATFRKFCGKACPLYWKRSEVFPMKKLHGIIKKGQGHDAGYKALFSHPKVVEDLITFFVRADFVKDIDFQTLAPYRENFVARGRAKRTLDVIWSVTIRDRGPAYFFILLEPQSTVYRWMPIRMLIYILLLYQDLIAKKKVKRHEKLPPVLPIVIYRGSRRWKAPLCIETLIEMPFEEFSPCVPKFSYLTIEAKHPKKLLLGLKSIMAKVFLFETASLENLDEVFNAFHRLYLATEDEELREIMKQWYENKMEMMHMESVDLDEWEAEKMFEAKVRRYEAKLRAEGMVKERAEAEKERTEAEKKRMEEKRDIARRLKERGLSRDDIKSIISFSDEEMEGL
jgi:predicted transposase/invertase (TIGR01784 family)